MKLKAFVGALENETLGFNFGSPWRYSDNSISCIIPIVRQNDNKPTYLVLPQTKDVKIEDSGQIAKVFVTNNEKLPLYLRMGELLKGATQERTLTLSRIIMPNQKAEVAVACVHASKGINIGTAFTYGGYTPENREAVYGASYAKGFAPNQSTSWEQDRLYASRASTGIRDVFMSREVKEDNLASVRDAVNKTYEEVLKKVPLLDNQIGIAIIDTQGLHSLDCFDLHIPFKAVKEALVGKESLSITKEDSSGVFQYVPNKAKETIKTVLQKGFQEKIAYQDTDTSTIILSYNGYIGEATLLGEDVIHLLISRESVG